MLQDKETYNPDGVECPYCGAVNKDSGDYELYTEDEIEMECCECEKEFLAYGYVSWSWTAKCIPCKEKHNFGEFGEWIKRDNGQSFQVRYCKICGETDYNPPIRKMIETSD